MLSKRLGFIGLFGFRLALTASFLVGACSGQPAAPTNVPIQPTTPTTPATPDSATLVMIDQAYNNFHTVGGRYAPFADLLRADGWTVQANTTPFSVETLRRGRVLVIANALAAENVTRWSLPTPSAFSTAAVNGVRDWVQAGGALLLIADHMPFPGAAEQLGAAFGITMKNGFAFDTTQLREPNTCLVSHEIHIFRRSDGSLASHAITNGASTADRVDSVATFTGQGFETIADVTPLMVFGATAVSLMPDSAWKFTSSTPRVAAAGWRQGAVRQFGAGRVAIFGEAAMFTSQTCGNNVPMGFNAPAASQNSQFVLNVVRWLSGRLN
jgi:hypothetical protein